MRDVTLRPDATGTWAEISLSSPGALRAGISLLEAGDMALSRRHDLPNRARLLSASGCPERVVGLRQIHSRRVIRVTDQSPEDLAVVEADGMVTDRPTLALTVTVADCLPIFLVDTARGAYGIVHSGWRGTGIVAAALDALREHFGTRPADVAATIGPGIGACCYRVPEERAELFAKEFGPDAVSRGADGEPRLDLRRANADIMRKRGVLEIGVVSECTCCSPRLGSFRRQGPLSYALMCAFLARG